MANLFRLPSGKLDRVYLRTCAAYKLLMAGRITKERAVELLAERRVGPAVVSHWVGRKEYRLRYAS